MVIKKVLNNLNITCDEAENGLISIDLHKEGKIYDLILMDKEMPVMDGHEVSLLCLCLILSSLIFPFLRPSPSSVVTL